jgi:hypothetical protein
MKKPKTTQAQELDLFYTIADDYEDGTTWRIARLSREHFQVLRVIIRAYVDHWEQKARRNRRPEPKAKKFRNAA